MNKADLAKLKKSLEDERELIFGQLQKIADINPDIKGDWKAKFNKVGGSLDEQAQSVTNYEERRAIEQSLEERLNEIDLVLGKIETNSYENCSECKSAISQKRLAAVPVTHLCMDCANKSTLV